MSTTIDSRVVEMKFDNSDFEKNVSTTMSTLEKLKEKLNFKGMANGLGELDKAARSVDISSIGDSADAVSLKLSAMQIAGAAAIGKLTTTAMGMAGTAVKKIINLISEGGKKRALNIEQAKFQIQGLGADWNALYKNMDEAVSGTAYGLDEAAIAAAQLTASGIEAGDQMERVLKGISGVAAMTNSSYSEISPIFTTIAGQSVVMTQQFRQLESRGLNAAATIGKYMLKNKMFADQTIDTIEEAEAAVREMAPEKMLSSQLFFDAMADAFAEQAKKANETFTGALANVKAAFSRIGEKFWTPMHEGLRRVFVELIPILKGVEKALGPVLEKLGTFILAVADKAANALNKFRKIFIDFNDAEYKFVGFMEKGTKVQWIINNLWQTAANVLGIITDTLKAFFTPFIGVIKTMDDYIQKTVNITHVMMTFTESIRNSSKGFSVFKNFLNDIGFAIARLKFGFANIIKSFTNILKFIGKFVKATFEAFKDVSQVGGIGKSVFDGLYHILMLVGDRFIDITGFIEKFTRRIRDAQKPIDIFKSALKIVLEVLKVLITVIGSIVNVLGNFIRIIGTIVGTVINVIGDFLNAIFGFAKSKIKLDKPVKGFMDFSDDVIKNLDKVVQKLREFNKKVDKWATNLRGKISAISKGGFVKFLSNLTGMTNETANSFVDTVKKYGSKSKEARKSAQMLSDGNKELADTALKAAGTFEKIQSILDKIKRILKPVRDGFDMLSDSVKNIASKFEKATEKVKGFFKGLSGDKLTSAISGLGSGVKTDGVDSLVDTFLTFGKDSDQYKNALKKVSGGMEDTAESITKMVEAASGGQKLTKFFQTFTRSGLSEYIANIGGATDKVDVSQLLDEFVVFGKDSDIFQKGLSTLSNGSEEVSEAIEGLIEHSSGIQKVSTYFRTLSETGMSEFLSGLTGNADASKFGSLMASYLSLGGDSKQYQASLKELSNGDVNLAESIDKVIQNASGWQKVTNFFKTLTTSGAVEYLEKLTGMDPSKLQDLMSVYINLGDENKEYKEGLDTVSEGYEENATAIDKIIKRAGGIQKVKNAFSTLTKSGAAEYLSELTGKPVERFENLIDVYGKAGSESREYQSALARLTEGNEKYAGVIDKVVKRAGAFKNGLKTLKQTFGLVTSFTKGGAMTYLTELTGKSSEKVEKLFKTFNKFGEKSKEYKKALTSLADGDKELMDRIDKVVKRVSDFKQSLLKVKDTIVAFGSSVWESLKSTFGSISDVLGSIFEGIDKNGVWDTIGSILDKIAEFFNEFANRFSDSTKRIKKSEKDLSIFDKISEKINSAFSKIKGVIDGISAAGVFDTLEKWFWKAVGVLERVGNAFKNALIFLFSDEGLQTGVGLAGMATIIETLHVVSDFVKKVGKGIDLLTGKEGVIQNICGTLKTLKETLEEYQKNLKAASLLAIGVAIALLVGSIYILASMDPDKARQSVLGASLLFGELWGVFKLMSKMDGGLLEKAGTAAIKMGATLFIMAWAVKILGEMRWQDEAKGIAGIYALLLGLFGINKLMSKFNARPHKFNESLIYLAGSLLIMALVVRLIGTLKPSQAIGGIFGVIALLGAIFALNYAMSKFKVSQHKFNQSMLYLAASLLILSLVVRIIGTMKPSEAAVGVVAVIVLLSALTVMMTIMSKMKVNTKAMNELGGGMILLAASMIVFALACRMWGSIDWEVLKQGGIAMGILLAAIMAFSMFANGSTMMELGAGMIILATSMLIFAKAITALGNIPWDILKVGLLTITALMVGFIIAMYLLKPVVSVMWAFSAAMKGIGIAALGVGAGIMLVAMALPLIAVGAAAAAAGIIAAIKIFLAGIASMNEQLADALASAGEAILDALGRLRHKINEFIANWFQDRLNNFKTFIPQIIDIVVELILKLLDKIKTLAPQFGDTIRVIIFEAIKTLKETAIYFINAGVEIIIAMVNAMVALVPWIGEQGMLMIVGFLQAIRDHIDEVITTGADIIVAFLQGIKDNLLRVIDAAWDVIIGFINGLSDSIDKNTPLLVDALKRLFHSALNAAKLVITSFMGPIGRAGLNLAKELVDKIKNKVKDIWNHIKSALNNAINGINGFVNKFTEAGRNIIEGAIGGIKRAASKIVDVVLAPFNKAIKAVKKLLGIGSPSKVFYKFGRWSDEGFINGVKAFASGIYNAIHGIGRNAISAMRDAIGTVDNVINGDIEFSPRIRPVVDLAGVQNGIDTMNSMFDGANAIAVQASFESGRMRQSDEETATKVINNNMTQNNYSPKALSRYEIYRDTQSMMSKMENAAVSNK